jgi:hypothetical protein
MFDASIVFCNYKSPRYCDNAKHESEALAQTLAKHWGWEDGKKISAHDALDIIARDYYPF